MIAVEEYDVVVIGAGPAGLSASIYTSENGLDTLVLDDGKSILKRNSHLENFLGFPDGVNSNLFLKMGRDQTEKRGSEIEDSYVTKVEDIEDGFKVETQSDEQYRARNVIVATKIDTEFLPGKVETFSREKTFIETDEAGRTNIEGLYAAGRIADKPDQAIIAAGHGAEVAMKVLEKENKDFYRDWIMPDGYFTLRGYEVPEGCEEISEEERKQKERKSLETMREYFSETFEGPDQHPSVD